REITAKPPGLIRFAAVLLCGNFNRVAVVVYRPLGHGAGLHPRFAFDQELIHPVHNRAEAALGVVENPSLTIRRLLVPAEIFPSAVAMDVKISPMLLVDAQFEVCILVLAATAHAVISLKLRAKRSRSAEPLGVLGQTSFDYRQACPPAVLHMPSGAPPGAR